MVETSNTINFSKFDVIGFAKKIFAEVESIRSSPALSNIPGNNEVSGIPNESRLNAFFRLIGFPMFVSAKKKDEYKNQNISGDLSGDIHITPGYGLTFSKKLSYYTVENAKSVINWTTQRELKLLGEETLIGTADKNEDMSSALLSAIPLQANIPEIKSLEDEIDDDVVADYWGFRMAFKALKPLITSYNSEGILPIKNQIARPFLLSPVEQMPTGETKLPKPFLETVIRIRLISCGGTSEKQDKNQQQFLDSIKNTLGGEELFVKAFSNDQELFTKTSILEQYVINILMASIVSLAKKWKELEKKQETLRNETSFSIAIKTNSGKYSPFGKRINITPETTLDEDSEKAQELKKLQTQKARKEALLSLFPTDDTTTNDANSLIKNNSNISLSALFTPFTTLLHSDLDEINKKIESINEEIKRKAQEAEILRVNLEMMTGEFTGLSIIDVVMVITALFLVDKKKLLYLLDKDVIEDMKKDPILRNALEKAGVSTSSVSDAKASIIEIEKLVDLLYTLLGMEIEKVQDKPKNRNLKRQQKKS